MTPIEITVTGTNPGSYPTLETWEWMVPAYLFLGGLVAGLMIFGAALRMLAPTRFARASALLDWVALPTIVTGLGLLWLDLSNRWNAWRFFATFRPASAMSWGSWILLATGLLLALRLATRLHRRGSPRGWLDRPWWLVRKLGAIGARYQRAVDLSTIVLGVALGLYTGFLLSQVSARPLWDSAFLPPLFLVSGIASGGAFLCLFLDETEHRILAPFSMATCGVEITMLTGYLLTTGAGALTGSDAGEILVRGAFASAFWALVVGAGLLVPLAIETLEIARKHIPIALARAAPSLKLLGGAALRFVVVFAGLETVL